MNVYVSILARFLTIIFAIELLRRLLFFAGWHSPISIGFCCELRFLCKYMVFYCTIFRSMWLLGDLLFIWVPSNFFGLNEDLSRRYSSLKRS